MQWWSWLILSVAVVIVAVAVFLAVQAKRRSGGVLIVDSDEWTAPDDETGAA